MLRIRLGKVGSCMLKGNALAFLNSDETEDKVWEETKPLNPITPTVKVPGNVHRGIINSKVVKKSKAKKKKDPVLPEKNTAESAGRMVDEDQDSNADFPWWEALAEQDKTEGAEESNE